MSLPTTGLEVRLAARPKGWPTQENFAVTEAEIPALGENQVLVRNLTMSVDPYMRGRMNDAKSYTPPFQLGKAMEGGATGEVIASNSPALNVGDLVLHQLGWREFAVVDATAAVKVDPELAPLNAYLGVLGMVGLTAYAGLADVAKQREGDVVFISGAAGAVGSLAGQIAKLRGASRVIGSAGSAEKVDYVTSELGFDAAFNYKDGPVLAQLNAAAPDGIDVYFDNVGGEHLEAAISASRLGARIAMCGAISVYNEVEAPPGPRNLFQFIAKRITMQGFLVTDHFGMQAEFVREVSGWIREGKLQYRETIVDGLRNAPTAFIDMLRGSNTGKMLVTIADR